jgi:signal transduction histidine kinase
MKTLRSCGCSCVSKSKTRHEATDRPVHATPEQAAQIRRQLAVIEELLARLFGPLYSREAESLKTRAQAADLVEEHFEGILQQWGRAVLTIFAMPDPVAERRYDSLGNALVRFIAHLRNPDDIATYIHLRNDCIEGMLAEAKPSQFNTIHIALKEIILNHVRSTLGARSEPVRNVVVAAIDERRLMVSQFYIESREAALRASEEKYRNSFDHAPDPMYEIEPETWKILGANAAALKLDEKAAPGDDPKSIIGVPITELVPPEMRPHMIDAFRKVMRDGPQQFTDVQMPPLYFDINEALISYGDKQFIQMIFHDVTQKREIMDTLLKAERLAAAGTFAAGVAHEVNNPLASISSLVQSLLTAEADSERRQTLHTILTQITRISGTLKDLVNFARPATPHRRIIDINALITETLRLVTYNKRFDGIAIEPQLARDLKASFADDNEIQQVLLNVLFNAADATAGRQGAIKVMTANVPPSRSADGARRIVIKVIDNGIGIARENLERVFDPFFTTKASGAGVGLGLSLCQRIILANHGTIRIDSEVGKGTTVAIILPAHEEATRAEGAAAQA